MDTSELGTIKFIPYSDNVVDNWNNIAYVNLNDGKEFFYVYDIIYTEQDIISLKFDSEFLKILERR